MKIRPIKTEIDYEKALARLELIFDASSNSKEGDEAEILTVLINNYEDHYHPIEAPDPIEAIKIRMEGLKYDKKIWLE
jgi:HTH-type transcriptional regulator/antitoxin HigA